MMTPDQFTEYLGRRYTLAKKVQGGTGANQHVQTGQFVQSACGSATAEALGAEYLGRRYLLMKKANSGWADRDLSGAQNEHPKTAESLAAEYLGRRYTLAKKAQGAPVGNRNAGKQSGQNDHFVSKTAESLGAEYGVGEATVRRAAWAA